MNKKIKVIDLINMQYKNEKMPKNIRIKYVLVFEYYTYNEKIKWYETADKTTVLSVLHKLDYEVEILEDNTDSFVEIENDLIEIKKDLIEFKETINKLEKAINEIDKKLEEKSNE